MLGKLLRGFTLFLLMVTLMATVIVQPASATPSEEVIITVRLIYIIPSSATTYGVWESSGSVDKSGKISETIQFAGWTDAGVWVKNVQGVLELFASDGVITLKSQVHEDSLDLTTGKMESSGTWVIADGTGTFAGLHGQGTVNSSGMVYSVCPQNDYGVTGSCIVETRTYTGQTHYEP